MQTFAWDSLFHTDGHVFRLLVSCLQGRTALHEAASVCMESLDVVKLLLANGADVNVTKDCNVSNASSMLADGH